MFDYTFEFISSFDFYAVLDNYIELGYGYEEAYEQAQADYEAHDENAEYETWYNHMLVRELASEKGCKFEEYTGWEIAEKNADVDTENVGGYYDIETQTVYARETLSPEEVTHEIIHFIQFTTGTPNDFLPIYELLPRVTDNYIEDAWGIETQAYTYQSQPEQVLQVLETI